MATTPEVSTQLYLESKNAILAYLVQNIDQPPGTAQIRTGIPRSRRAVPEKLDKLSNALRNPEYQPHTVDG